MWFSLPPYKHTRWRKVVAYSTTYIKAQTQSKTMEGLLSQRDGVQAGITGVQVNYYFICKTKLWLFSHNTKMEQESDIVAMGKVIHENSYARNKKEIRIGPISIDFIKKGDEILLHEIKKSKKMEQSHIYQLLYYLYYLKSRGIRARGLINYPNLRRTKEVELTKEKEEVLREVLEDIKSIILKKRAPLPEKKTYCRKCSYFEFCWVK